MVLLKYRGLQRSSSSEFQICACCHSIVGQHVVAKFMDMWSFAFKRHQKMIRCPLLICIPYSIQMCVIVSHRMGYWRTVCFCLGPLLFKGMLGHPSDVGFQTFSPTICGLSTPNLVPFICGVGFGKFRRRYLAYQVQTWYISPRLATEAYWFSGSHLGFPGH